jgi:hypothetical protein
MAEATNSLPQSTFQPVSASAVHVLARMAARRAVQEQLRADGVRVSLVKPAEITAKGRGLSRRSSRIVSRSARACAAPGQWAFLLNETQERKSEQMTTIGYARVSTDGQTLAAQTEALHGAGCARIFAEKISGAYSDRPQLAKAIAVSAGGDCLVVCKLDRLARSTRDLLNTLDAIGKAGASFRSLADQWGRYNHTTRAIDAHCPWRISRVRAPSHLVEDRRRSHQGAGEWSSVRKEAFVVGLSTSRGVTAPPLTISGKKEAVITFLPTESLDRG